MPRFKLRDCQCAAHYDERPHPTLVPGINPQPNNERANEPTDAGRRLQIQRTCIPVCMYMYVPSSECHEQRDDGTKPTNQPPTMMMMMMMKTMLWPLLRRFGWFVRHLISTPKFSPRICLISQILLTNLIYNAQQPKVKIRIDYFVCHHALLAGGKNHSVTEQ